MHTPMHTSIRTSIHTTYPQVRGEIKLAVDASEAEARALAMADPKVTKFLEGKEVKKFIYVPGRIVNFVAK